MPNPIHVPDIPGPRRPLCWKQDPATMSRCDRAQHHAGLHTWEWAAITVSLAEAEAELCDPDGWREDLLDAGWFEKSHTSWVAPDGTVYRGPYGAWHEMKRRQRKAKP